MSDAAKAAIQGCGAGFASVEDAGGALLRIVSDSSIVGMLSYLLPQHSSLSDI